jgi:hypothetical protein
MKGQLTFLSAKYAKSRERTRNATTLGRGLPVLSQEEKKATPSRLWLACPQPREKEKNSHLSAVDSRATFRMLPFVAVAVVCLT